MLNILFSYQPSGLSFCYQGIIAVMDEECLRPGEENDQVSMQSNQ